MKNLMIMKDKINYIHLPNQIPNIWILLIIIKLNKQLRNLKIQMVF